MPDLPSRKRRIAVVALAFVTGTLVGVLATSAAASRASRLYLAMLRVGLAGEEGDQAAAAWSRGETGAALVHSACAVVAEHGPEVLDPSHTFWNMTFPMFGLFVADRPCWGVCDFTVLEAQSRARLAVVLERVGMHEEKERQLAEVVRLTGKPDKTKWLEVGRVMLDRPLGKAMESESRKPSPR